MENQSCQNCGAAVSLKFCSTCGQRVEDHINSFLDFLGEFAEVFTHADSRLWRTLKALLLAPGFLTEQFLAGRRASYLAPLRLYLVTSVGFFLVITLTSTTAAPDLTEQVSNTDAHCAESANVPGPPWIREKLLLACEKSQNDHGRQLGEDFIHNLGRAMFVFLPLLAAMMKLLYWHPQRPYLFHLVLLLHNQACVFLLMAVVLVARQSFPSSSFIAWVHWLLIGYLVFYLYRSMRRVYGETKARTLVKFGALSLGYAVCAVFFVFVTAVYSVQTL